MKAVVFHGPGKMSVDEVPDPRIEQPGDIILRVTTAICGSDLHIYNGLIPQAKPMVMGHEFMGIVQETGSDVTAVETGDRVVVPFPIACGGCYFCDHGLSPHCEHSNPEKYGPEGALLTDKGGGLFGYTDMYGGYSGGQAQYQALMSGDRVYVAGGLNKAMVFSRRFVPESLLAKLLETMYADVKPENHKREPGDVAEKREAKEQTNVWDFL